MEKVWKIANLYVAMLRQMYLIHQYSHWTTRGEAFYGDHLLFERLYKSAGEDADLAAEKMIGLFGAEGVEFNSQRDFMSMIAAKYAEFDGEPAIMSLKAEKDFLEYSKQAYESFKDEGVLSLGLDDMIMSIASKRAKDCSTPSLPVLHCLPRCAQVHVH